MNYKYYKKNKYIKNNHFAITGLLNLTFFPRDQDC